MGGRAIVVQNKIERERNIENMVDTIEVMKGERELRGREL